MILRLLFGVVLVTICIAGGYFLYGDTVEAIKEILK